MHEHVSCNVSKENHLAIASGLLFSSASHKWAWGRALHKASALLTPHRALPVVWHLTSSNSISPNRTFVSIQHSTSITCSFRIHYHQMLSPYVQAILRTLTDISLQNIGHCSYLFGIRHLECSTQPTDNRESTLPQITPKPFDRFSLSYELLPLT